MYNYDLKCTLNNWIFWFACWISNNTSQYMGAKFQSLWLRVVGCILQVWRYKGTAWLLPLLLKVKQFGFRKKSLCSREVKGAIYWMKKFYLNYLKFLTWKLAQHIFSVSSRFNYYFMKFHTWWNIINFDWRYFLQTYSLFLLFAILRFFAFARFSELETRSWR